MTDIVDRLLRHWDGKRLAAVSTDVADAADTIAELREELREARELMKDTIDGWDWWQKDQYDRCQSVPANAVDEMRAFLAKTQPKGTAE